jgi:hypothetical protein
MTKLSPVAPWERLPPLWGLLFFLCGGLLEAQRPLLADPLQQALGEQRHIQQEAIQSQQRIDALDDDSRRLLEDYRAAQAGLGELQRYNAQMQRMVQTQQRGIADLGRQMDELEDTRRRILPLMLEMVDALERFIAVDTPFLGEERSLRLKGLRALMDAPETGLGEKFRRLLEAYRIEADYAYSIEAYTGELMLGEERVTVDYLRLGRSALYWLSLDGGRSGLWDARNDRWRMLDPAHAAAIEQAIRVARKQAPPELLTLPLAAAGPEPDPHRDSPP